MPVKVLNIKKRTVIPSKGLKNHFKRVAKAIVKGTFDPVERWTNMDPAILHEWKSIFEKESINDERSPPDYELNKALPLGRAVKDLFEYKREIDIMVVRPGVTHLRNDEEDFFDVTLACGSKHIKAHKVILSACSSFFRSLIKSIPHQHPLLYLRGIDFNHLESVLCFMYNGEVRIKPHELDQFLSIAQELKVNGLMQDQSTNGVNKFETTAPKRSISTTDDLSLHEVKRESSPPLHLQNKRIALSTTERKMRIPK
ncbi:unnamed protein product [Lepeophtheirus salmonis]|uniref:(salmon louse) hypothetical protein n=1 Tax=Lepeophtheirus salmonis TaxID=72036 RepID=A0A7R8CKU1_LEPSM|nr:unnamed protein product [Lepeophtheirus salmonis]CAF2849207.1 unnamed protein product [Lepeophtheirus salmonis]